MFEKEAEEYANRKCGTIQDNEWKFCNLDWKEGAEFGYNKANEWHYPKNGDLPPKTTLVLIKACGCFILGWLDDNDVWHNDSNNGARIPKDNVYAWKEIVPPKESE